MSNLSDEILLQCLALKPAHALQLAQRLRYLGDSQRIRCADVTTQLRHAKRKSSAAVASDRRTASSSGRYRYYFSSACFNGDVGTAHDALIHTIISAGTASAVFLGYFNHTKFQTNLFDNSPREGGVFSYNPLLGPCVHEANSATTYLVCDTAVTELCGRVFAIWTLLTCALCCICARNPCVPSIYGKLQRAHMNRQLYVRPFGRGCFKHLSM